MFSYFKIAALKNILTKNVNCNKFFTFVEVDYYTNTAIILKNYNELNEKEMSYFVSNFSGTARFKTFIE
jgi:hypothetical protein